MKFAKRIQKVQPSMTLAIDTKAKELKLKGVDVIGFGAGEPDFPTAQNVKEAAIEAIRNNKTRYTPASGVAELIKAIVEKFKMDHGLVYDPNQIIVSCGAKHSLFNLAQVLWENGDEVLIPSPYWVSYPEIVKLSGAKPIIIETTGATEFKIIPEQLEEKITSRTQALILNSPSNPTGSAYTKKELEGLAEIVLKHNLTIITDEIYEKIVFDNFEQFSIASLSNEVKKNCIVVNGVSKAYCMTGWRIGYLAAEPKIAQAINKLQGQSTSNPSSISQMAALEALTGSQDYITDQVKEFQTRRNFLIEGLNALPDISCYNPAGTFYSFPDFSKTYGRSFDGKEISGSIEMGEFLLEQGKVALVPGIAFGADNYLRMSFACSRDDLGNGLQRINKALNTLE